MTRNLVHSVTKKDFDWQYIKGTGKGGQKRNKTCSAVRCTHRESGAQAFDDATRQQHRNKVNAFRKCVNTQIFKSWHKIEIAKTLGVFVDIDKVVAASMEDENIKTEVKEDGKWKLL